jgi:hypothetical protein
MMVEISPLGKNGRERKEKKGGDEGFNGFKLPFPFASSFHSFLWPKYPQSVERKFFSCWKKIKTILNIMIF